VVVVVVSVIVLLTDLSTVDGQRSFGAASASQTGSATKHLRQSIGASWPFMIMSGDTAKIN
jgi:hypothetical protein